MLTRRRALGKSSPTLKLPTGHTSKEETKLRRSGRRGTTSGWHLSDFPNCRWEAGMYKEREGSQLMTLPDTLFLAM
jgi:hypothetical protein